MAKDFEGARRYIRQIRNARKQAYAAHYFAYLTGEGATAPSEDGLSYMGAQAVRMRLGELGFWVTPRKPLTGDCSVDCLEACAYPGQFSECSINQEMADEQ